MLSISRSWYRLDSRLTRSGSSSKSSTSASRRVLKMSSRVCMVRSQAACFAVTNAARLATLEKWLRVSLASASILMPYFFWIARPSSRASTESRPRPSPNRVWLSPMSSTLMSSRPRASMISVLISRCRSLIFGELLDKVGMQILVEFARGLRWRPLRGEGLWVYIGPHTKTEVHAAFWDPKPGLGLGQCGRADFDDHRGEDFRTPQGNGRSAPMKGRRLAGLGAGAQIGRASCRERV